MANKKKLIYADDARRAILEADPKLAYCIERIKAVDAVEVVRCKDCVNCGGFDHNGVAMCFEYSHYVYGDYYCADGERKYDGK